MVLPVDHQALLLASAEERMSSKLADEQRLTLSPEERRCLQLFIHSSCGSHKLSNLFKHGMIMMYNAWPEGEGPILLFNKDNQAIIDDAGDEEDDPGYGDSQCRAVSMAQGGGVKLTALAAAVFNNSNTKCTVPSLRPELVLVRHFRLRPAASAHMGRGPPRLSLVKQCTSSFSKS